MTVNHSVPLQSPLIQRKHTVTSIEVVRDSVFKDHAAQWSGVERERIRYRMHTLQLHCKHTKLYTSTN